MRSEWRFFNGVLQAHMAALGQASRPPSTKRPGILGADSYVSDLIYDVGAHDGQDSDFYLKKGFRVVAIECNPVLVKQLRQRFAREEANGQFTLLPIAVSSTPGEIDFYINEVRSVWGTTQPDFALRNAKMGAPSRKVKVEARPFESVLAQYGVPYYLKVDIEGSDMMCLEALRSLPDRPRYLSIEAEQSSWSAVIHAFDLLQALGYMRFQLVSQSMVPEQRVPAQALEGNHTEHVFPHGATGLFGRELPGAWIDRAGALRYYRRIFLRHKLFGHNTPGAALLRLLGPRLKQLQYRLSPGWWDTHAALGTE